MNNIFEHQLFFFGITNYLSLLTLFLKCLLNQLIQYKNNINLFKRKSSIYIYCPIISNIKDNQFFDEFL